MIISMIYLSQVCQDGGIAQNIAAENLLGVSRPLVYLDMGKSSIVLKTGHETNTRFVGIGGRLTCL